MVAPISCKTKLDNGDASKQSKTSSGESPELVFMTLEVAGKLSTKIYDARNHPKLQKFGVRPREMVAPISCKTKIDNEDASKQSKTSSGGSPELVFTMLETTRNSKKIAGKQFRGIP